MATTGISYSGAPVTPVNGLPPAANNIQTGVTATQAISPQVQAAQDSQMYAQAFQQANPLSLMSSVYNPSSGTQLGANALGRMAPMQASILSNGLLGVQNQNLANAQANANSQLQGQQLQGSTGLSLDQLLNTTQGMNYNQGIQNNQFGQTAASDLLGGNGGGFLGDLLGGII